MMNRKLVLQLLVVSIFMQQHIEAMVQGATRRPNPMVFIDQSIASSPNQCVYLKRNDKNQVTMMQPGNNFDPQNSLQDYSNYLLISSNKNFNGSVIKITGGFGMGEPPYFLISASTCEATTDSNGNTTISPQGKPTKIIESSSDNISIYSDSTQPSRLNFQAFTPTQIIPTETSQDILKRLIPVSPTQTPQPIQTIPEPTPQARFTGQFSVNLANQSSALLDISDNTGKQYSASQNQMQNINSVKTLKIKMSSSNRGYLQVSTRVNGSIQVVEYDTNNRPISKYVLYYNHSSIPVPQIMVYDNPQLMSSSGFILMIQEDSLQERTQMRKISGQPMIGVYENGHRID